MRVNEKPSPSTAEPRPTRKRGCGIAAAILLILCGVLALSLNSLADDPTLIVKTLDVTNPPCGTWQATTGPGFGANGTFDSVAASAPNDVWAFGSTFRSIPLGKDSLLAIPLSLSREPVAAHWDGNRWRVMPMPGAGMGRSVTFPGAVALSSEDIWAVGASYTRGGYNGRTAIAHWDGKRWSTVPSPNINQYANELTSVAAIAPDDIWALGYYDSGPCCAASSQPLLTHWDGKQWTIDNSLDLSSVISSANYLLGIAAAAADDVWAIGYYCPQYCGADSQPLAVHWNGKGWRVVPMPSTQYGAYPSAVAAVSSNDIWAVGVMGLIMHWDGAQWHIVDNPLAGRVAEHLDSVVAISSTDVWAVGHDAYNGNGYILHWDGKAWTSVVSPIPSRQHQGFFSATKTSADEIWAVGGKLLGIEEGPWYAMAARFTRSACAAPTANTP